MTGDRNNRCDSTRMDIASKHKVFIYHLYNVEQTSKTLGQRCTNVIEMFPGFILNVQHGEWVTTVHSERTVSMVIYLHVSNNIKNCSDRLRYFEICYNKVQLLWG